MSTGNPTQKFSWDEVDWELYDDMEDLLVHDLLGQEYEAIMNEIDGLDLNNFEEDL